MTQHRKNLRIVGAVVLFFILLFGHPWFYLSKSIEGRVIDKETGKPIEGVVVTANWELDFGTPGGDVSVGNIQVLEAVTDKDGKYSFPEWGPRLAWNGHLTSSSPQLLFFKPGYRGGRKLNAYKDVFKSNHTVRTSDWNNETIELLKYKGSPKEYGRHLSYFTIDLGFITENCSWKKTPRMILTLQKQVDAFSRAGMVKGLYSVDYLPNNENKCGSVKEFFERYEQ